MQPVMLVVGTRPEGIKMMPVYFALKEAHIPVVLCSTDQHSHLLQEVFDLFAVVPDVRLSVMKPGQDLSYITCTVLEAMKHIYATYNPSLVLVQGDTTTVMAAALAAFYARIPVGHVEAGLRTGDKYSPYPEEINRCFVGQLAEYHFAPTAHAVGVLLAEGKSRSSVFYTGNTVVDALYAVQALLRTGTLSLRPELQAALAFVRRFPLAKKILLTVHRRESFPDGVVRILTAFKTYARMYPETIFFYPSHPNPVVMQAISELQLSEEKNIFLFPALAYHELVSLLELADCVATDSGGIQEEAVSLGKPVLVLREKSERMEGVWEGLATIVGTQEKDIIDALDKVLALQSLDQQQVNKSTVYGDGHAAKRIVTIVKVLQKQQIHCAVTQKSVSPSV